MSTIIKYDGADYLIYGSTALNFWFENTHYSNGLRELREPQDLDVIIKSDYNNQPIQELTKEPVKKEMYNHNIEDIKTNGKRFPI